MTNSYKSLDGSIRPLIEEVVDAELFDLEISGLVEPGHGAASGKSPRAKHPRGTLAMQYRYLLERGVDLGAFYTGTLNVSIAPATYVIHRPWKRVDNVKWAETVSSENFLLARCCVGNSERTVCGLLYQPDPTTKTEHFDNPSHLQIIAPFLPNAGYGSHVSVYLVSAEVGITRARSGE